MHCIWSLCQAAEAQGGTHVVVTAEQLEVEESMWGSCREGPVAEERAGGSSSYSTLPERLGLVDVVSQCMLDNMTSLQMQKTALTDTCCPKLSLLQTSQFSKGSSVTSYPGEKHIQGLVVLMH